MKELRNERRDKENIFVSGWCRKELVIRLKDVQVGSQNGGMVLKRVSP